MTDLVRPGLEPRLPCPVCTGVLMYKARVTGKERVQLDHCRRCGGVWFDVGEVQQLRRIDAATFWRVITRMESARPPQCRACGAIIDRAAAECAACTHHNLLDCPQCMKPLDVARHEDVTLDVCRNCRGIWFDHVELSAIWRLEVGRALEHRKRHGPVDHAADGSLVLLDALAFDPFLAFYGVQLAAHGAAAAGQALAHAPGALAGAAEVAGEAASSVFETILEIIAGIFS